jgi:hypothetical protein
MSKQKLFHMEYNGMDGGYGPTFISANGTKRQSFDEIQAEGWRVVAFHSFVEGRGHGNNNFTNTDVVVCELDETIEITVSPFEHKLRAEECLFGFPKTL